MRDELTTMEDNNTWSIVALPPDKKSIGCRWVYTNKFNSDGSLARHKARLVENGYNQREGVDFIDTSSHVAKLTIVNVLLP